MHQMQKDQIPDFVREVVTAGCNVSAVGQKHYVIDDGDLSESACAAAKAELDRIRSKYGTRDHLKLEIIGYLHSIGRSYPPSPIR